MRRDSGEWRQNLRIWAYRESWPRAAGRAPLPHTERCSRIIVKRKAYNNMKRFVHYKAHTLYASEEGREKNSWHPHGNSSSLASGATEIRESIDESSVRSHQVRNYPSYRGPPRVRRSTLSQGNLRLRLVLLTEFSPKHTAGLQPRACSTAE